MAQLGIIVFVGHMIDDHVPARVLCIQALDDLLGEVAFDCRAVCVDVVIVYVGDVALYIRVGLTLYEVAFKGHSNSVEDEEA